jgi:addiction module HigA family antidote
MPMKNPCHPGEILKEECLIPLGLTVTEAAKMLDISRYTLSSIINQKQGISTEMALRLSKAFGMSAEVWLNMQVNYDLAQVRNKVNLDNVQVIVTKSA